MSGRPDRLSKEEHQRIFRDELLPEAGLDRFTPQEHPRAIILAGQPGAGKGGLVRAARQEFDGDIFPVDPDEQRQFHPDAERWQQESPYGWPQKTNADAGAWAGELRDAAIERRVNMVIDTTLGDARSATRLIEGLQKTGYEVEIRTVAAHSFESEHGIDERFTRRIDLEGVGRDVPLEFHDKVYRDLPENLDKVREATGVTVRIYDRSGAELYDSRWEPTPPSAALTEARNARLEDPEITQQLRERWHAQADWHRELPERIEQGDLKLSPETADALRREQLERGKVELSAQRAEATATIDEAVRIGAPPARAPIPEVDSPELGRVRTMGVLTSIGVAAMVYDAKETGDRISTAFAQDNPVAARSEATQFVARGVGGTAAGLTPVALGVTGGPAVALAVADAYLLTKGFERLAERMDLSKIINQEDREGVAWELNGRQWLRKDLEADLRVDGVDKPFDQNFAAPPQKVRELNYLASMEATGQAIGKASPQNPFVQSTSDSDPAHLYSRNWMRSAETGEWSRMVADEVSRNDAPLWKPEAASHVRAAELDLQATQVIDSNIADGPAPIAARYEAAHRRNGWDSFGPEPDAVRTALNPDTLQASNGDQYVRNAQGQWSHGGEVAQGNLALELETMRERLIPALSQHEAQLAKLPAWQPPTPEQQDRENLRQMYTDFRVDPTSEQFEAAYQAVQRTRKVEGIDPATSSLGLEPRPNNDYSIATPIQHLRFDSEGVVRVTATTAVDIMPSKEVALSGAPHAIEAPSAREREGQTQAQREANRIGLSQDETQSAVRMAAPAMSAPGGRSDKPEEPDRAPKEEAKPERRGAMMLDNPSHEDHGMFAAALRAVNDRDAQMGRQPDEVSRQLAGGLVEKARERGLETIGAAKFTPDGTKVGMTDTADLSAPWAKTAVGDVGQLAGQKFEQSSENVAAINQKLALEQSLQPPPPTQGLDGPAPKGPRLV